MNLSNNVKIDRIKSPQESAQTTVYSDAVDTATYDGLILFTVIDSASGNANHIKAQACDLANFSSGVEDIDDSILAPDEDAQICMIDISAPPKRYIRLVEVRAGKACATNGMYALFYDGIKTPIDNDDTDSKVITLAMPQAADPVGNICTPAITSPEEGDIDIAIDTTITASAFAVVDSTAEHEKSQFQITEAADTLFEIPVVDVEVETGTLTEYELAGTELNSETDYLVRVRYFTTTLGWSDWSPVIAFNTISSGMSITSITPASGVNTGGTAVTIDGTEFVAGLGVTFDDVAATSVVRVSATRLTCVTPVGTTGAVDVKVTNTDGGTVTEASGFTYISTPTVDSLDVTSGTNDGGTTVVITGTEFAATPGVKFGTVDATDIVRDSATQITCKTPVHANGAITVTVTNTDGGSGSKGTAFTFFSSPTITLVDPDEGAAAGGTPVTITGTEFAATPAVTFDGVTATSIVRVSATEITCVTPAGTAGAVDVVVTNTDTGTVTATDGFTYTE